MKKVIIFVLFIALPLLAGCSASQAGDGKPPASNIPPVEEPRADAAVAYPLVPPDPAAGEGIYAEHCASCHGELGYGAGQNAGTAASSPSALAHPSSLRSAIPQEWFTVTKDGRGSMPGFASKLDDRANWNIIAYLLSMENTYEQMMTGADIYYGVCSQCHGSEGKGDGPNAGALSTRPADFTDQSFMAAISNQAMMELMTTGIGDMPGFANMLTENEKWAVTNFIRSLSFALVETPGTPGIPETSAQSAEDPDAIITLESTPDLVEVPGPVQVKIYGKVINDSGSTLPDGMIITLLVFDNMQQTGMLETVANAAGDYEFENVEMLNGRIFITSAEYNGYSFSSQPSRHPGMEVVENQTEINLPIHLYDTSTDISTISADRLHVFMDFNTPGLIQVMELYLISNHSNQVITAKEPGDGILYFTLPDKAANLQFQDSTLGERYLATDDGFADTEPVYPGEASHQVLFMYDLPYTSRLKVDLPVSINVETVNIMLPAENIRLKSGQLEDAGVRVSQGMSFHLYTGGALPAGGTLQMTLTGKMVSKDSGNTRGDVNEVMLGLGIFLLAVTGVGFYFYRQQKGSQEGLVTEDINLADKEAIMDAIIALDSLHEAGKIKESVYQARREELKSKLKSMM